MRNIIARIVTELAFLKLETARPLWEQMVARPMKTASLEQALAPFAFIARRILSLPEPDRCRLAGDMALLLMDCDPYFAWWCYLHGHNARPEYSAQILEYRNCTEDYPLLFEDRRVLCDRALVHMQDCIAGRIRYSGDDTPEAEVRTMQVARERLPSPDPLFLRDLRCEMDRWQPPEEKPAAFEEAFWQNADRYRTLHGAFYALMSRSKTAVIEDLTKAQWNSESETMDVILWLESEPLPHLYHAVCAAQGIEPYLSRKIAEEVLR